MTVVVAIESRRVRKVGVQAQQRRLDYVRWGLVAVVLLLLAVGLYYYLTSVNQPGRAVGRGGRREGGGGGGKVTDKTGKQVATEKRKATDKSKPKSTKTGSEGSKSSRTAGTEGKKKKKKKSTGEKMTSSKEQQKSEKSKHKSEPNTIDLSNIRLLRRPVPAEDADRPYIIEILNGDNLLVEGRYSEGLEKFNEVLKMFPQSPRGLYGKGETLRGMAEQKSSNKLMDTAIAFYQDAADSFLASKDLKVGAS